MSSVNHPHHYNTGKFEVIDVIEDWGLGFNLGNTIKYIARAGKKDHMNLVVDLMKAKWYLEREIEKHCSLPGPDNEDKLCSSPESLTCLDCGKVVAVDCGIIVTGLKKVLDV